MNMGNTERDHEFPLYAIERADLKFLCPVSALLDLGCITSSLRAAGQISADQLEEEYLFRPIHRNGAVDFGKPLVRRVQFCLTE
jgi:hypothetical protein